MAATLLDHLPLRQLAMNEEYSLDASRWRLVHPKDGIPDSRREDFQVLLDEGDAARNVIIRVTDAMNNVATAVAEIKKN